MQQTKFARGRSFRVGRWLVHPELNRVSADGEEVQLEPRGMDLLIFLTEHAGEVMSRQDILDAVWQQDFVGDTTLSSAIAVLRRALHDEVRNPRYIETIAKRGYRLVAEVVDPETVATVTPFPGLVAPRERSPYPGLAAFPEADAELFFGREEEAAALWAKIPRKKLLAVIGPSGVGKSSFVNAGVIPSAPEKWGTLVFEPGEAPFSSLARALAPEFSGDTEAVQQLLACHDPDVALSLLSRWRERWGEALLVVDQFEELFTLNSAEAQAGFADLLSRLVVAAHVHVVLVMRDDFLYDCHAHPGLAPVYKDLTVLGPLAAKDLQRALIEPARRSGCLFEDESLAEEMVAEMAGERGATSMLAFSVSRLWELRDREQRLIKRQAYESIGGVTGALAQHAEQVIEVLGDDHQPLVREIFRNLVTGQGTRAASEVGELLSVFSDDQQTAATEILQELVSGRLLTAFEVPAAKDESASTHHRVEIVHESLLATWPRLVRWQTQDADAAQLRDQVRQAARLWDDQGRSDDLLWSGTAYRELRLWQERYPGGLSAVEEAFVRVSTELTGRRRRRKRLVVAAGMLALATVAVVVTGLWRRSVHQARRAEARQLLHLGQLVVDRAPGSALARAIASLELEDDPEVRHLAMRALWKGPKGLFALKETDNLEWPTAPQFSPDGRWLAAGYWTGEVALWPASGGAPTVWQGQNSPTQVLFSPDSSTLLTVGWSDPAYRFWSVPDGRSLGEQPIQNWQPPTEANWTVIGNVARVLRVTPSPDPNGARWHVDPLSEELAQWLNSGDPRPGVLDPSGELVAYGDGGDLFLARVGSGHDRIPRLVGRHDQSFQQIAFRPDGKQIATVDATGGLQLWSVDAITPGLARAWDSETAERCVALVFHPSGSYVVSAHGDGKTRVWGITDPPDADPMRIVTDRTTGHRLSFDTGVHGLSFGPGGRWLATTGPNGVGIWPFDRARHGHVLRGHEGSVDDLAFGPDGTWLISASSDGTVRWWPLAPSGGARSRVLFDWGEPSSFSGLSSVALAPDGSFAVVAIGGSNVVRVLSLDGRLLDELPLPPGDVHALAFGPGGEKVAVGSMAAVASGIGGSNVAPLLLVWDLATGEVSKIDFSLLAGTFQGLEFADEGALLAAGAGGLLRWDPTTKALEPVLEGMRTFAVCRGHDMLVGAISGPAGLTAVVYDLATGATRPLTSHGSVGDTLNVAKILATDRACTVVAAVRDREIRVGPITGEAPHLILGPEDAVHAVAVSPNGRWIAAGSRDGTIRLWPVPNLARAPLHTLPRAELLDRLRALTLARWVRNESSPDSYEFARAPFPGWETVPEW